MNMPKSTIDSVGRANFDEKKAYVPQEAKGQAFVLLPLHFQLGCLLTGIKV